MTSADSIDGVLPVDKPVGPTSHDIVAMTRRALRTRRVGHTGTLDPFASGLLLLCIGSATRLAEYLTGWPKQYRATLRLGQATDTDDLTGAVLFESDAWQNITRATFEDALAAFRGDYAQVPSTYSAKQLNGERAYQAARAGRQVALAPVHVHIDRLEVIAYEPPLVTIDVSCSSGTYVRALARDIGQALDVGAHLVALRRTAVGGQHVDGALTVEQLNDAERVRTALVAPMDAIGDMPRVQLEADEAERVRHGQALARAYRRGTVALVAADALIAIAESDGAVLRPRKVFVS